MQRLTSIAAIVALVLGVVVLVFAEGLRRWYSGLFLVGIGVVLLINSRRSRDDGNGQ